MMYLVKNTTRDNIGVASQGLMENVIQFSQLPVLIFLAQFNNNWKIGLALLLLVKFYFAYRSLKASLQMFPTVVWVSSPSAVVPR